MKKRVRIIRQRASENFGRENRDPDLTLEMVFAEPGDVTKAAVPEDTYRECYARAERELIEEGAIEHA